VLGACAALLLLLLAVRCGAGGVVCCGERGPRLS
jgi:hypothetical protein